MQDRTTYVGIDAHKKEHHLAILAPGSDGPQESKVPNQPKAIASMVRRTLKRCPGPVVFAYEAGVCGFALQRDIERAGGQCKVIAPSLIPRKPSQRVYTDRRDARNLAAYLRAGVLTEVRPPTEPQETIRDFCRQRDAARRDLMRVRHQVLKYLLRRGRVYSEGHHWTQKHLRWLSSLRFDPPLAEEVFGDYLAELDHRQRRLERLDRRLAELADSEPYRQRVGYLRCFRGIDTVTALSLVAELHGIEHFDGPRQLMSFVGLTPSEASSGESRRRGEITKAGNGRARRLLIEAAWHQRHGVRTSKTLAGRRVGQPRWAVAIAERAQVRLYRRYRRLLGRGKIPGKVVTAVARELAGFIWAVLRRVEPVAAAGVPDRREAPPGGGAVCPRSARAAGACAEAVPSRPRAKTSRRGAGRSGHSGLTPRQGMRQFLEGRR